MYSFRRWIYCLLFLIPFPAYSAVTYETVRLAPGVYAPSGATQHDVTVATRRPDGVTRYHNIRPTMPPSTLGRLGRAAVRGGPASIAVTGIIEGLGYLIDQATGDIKKIEITYGPPTGDWVWGQNVVVLTRPLANVDELYAHCSQRQYCAIYYFTPGVSAQSRAWDCPLPGWPVGYTTIAPNSDAPSTNGRCYVADSTQDPIETIIDLDPSDYHVIDTALADQLTLQQKTDLARRILTMTNSEIATIWPELSALAEAVRSAEQAVYDATLDPSLTPTPEQEAIVGDGNYELPHVYPDSPGEGGDGFWPAFCEWASFICAPFVESEHPPLPTADINIDDYDSGLPDTAACPAPLEVVTNFGQWEISFEPACQFAESIRVPLLAISYLIAGFIVVGVRR